MRMTVMIAAVLALCSSPTLAQHRGGGGGFGSAFGGAALGGVLGGVIGNAISQPPPAPVYVVPPPPPVIVERRVYVPEPVYAPTQRISYHPWAGPGFVCYDPEPNSVNRAICGSEALSAAALSVTQAVYAGIQQTPYGAGSLRSEFSSFMQSVRSTCAPYSYQQQGDCISGMFARQHDVFAGRLTGASADEANRPVTVNLQVQQRLRDMGLLTGVVDGIFGDGTRRAMASWQRGQGRQASGILTNEEVALLVPGFQDTATAAYVPPALAPAVAPKPLTQQVSASPVAQQLAVPASVQVVATQVAPEAANDPLAGVRENMPYALARPKLFAVGWQTQFFKTDGLSDKDRDARQWFTDHRIGEVEDCSSSGCKIQLHNMDGRLLYIYTQSGSRASDAYRGAGPAVIALCLDVDDITCPSATAIPAGAPVGQAVVAR